MSNISKSLTTFVLFLPILMVAGQAKAEMTSDQIKAAVSGKTFTFTGDDNGTASFAADGTAWLTLEGDTKSAGKWRVNNNQLCSQWDGEEEDCATWTDEGGKYVTSSGYTMTPQ